MQELEKFKTENTVANITDFWNDFKELFDKFSKKVGTKPKANAIKKNKFANNAEYLEIGYLEMQLDRVFHGQWTFEVTECKLLLNAIQVTGVLSVLHPVSGVWIKRAGIAAKQVQLASKKTEYLPENLSSKALERDVPIAKAEAFKNAVKSLGNAFGRHLNRKFNLEFIEDKDDIFSKKIDDDKL